MTPGSVVPAELLARYDVQGPRYTSYPTAPQFHEDVDQDALRAAWRDASADLSLYVHVPFCAVRCSFCGCHVKITSQVERGSPYVSRLLAELDLAAQRTDLARPLQQLHLGGGTPNFLPPAELRRLVEGLDARTRPAAGAERAIELDPRSLSEEQVRTLQDLGFNRFSLGVQDLEPGVMAAVNRPQSLATVQTVVGWLRARGAVPLNFDLIVGLPKQTAATWTRTLAAVLELAPTRLAVYAYAHVPWLKPHQVALERAGLPGPAQRAEFTAMARAALLGSGYVELGFDHFALPDDELAEAARTRTLHRNFMGFSTRRGLDQVAIGASAISHVGASYVQDAKDQVTWERRVDAGEMPWERGLVLTPDDVRRGEIILDLSCNGHLDIAAFEQRHGLQFAAEYALELGRLKEFESDGLLRISRATLDVTPLGMRFVRNLCMVFDAWLAKDAARGGPRYSATV